MQCKTNQIGVFECHSILKWMINFASREITERIERIFLLYCFFFSSISIVFKFWSFSLLIPPSSFLYTALHYVYLNTSVSHHIVISIAVLGADQQVRSSSTVSWFRFCTCLKMVSRGKPINLLISGFSNTYCAIRRFSSPYSQCPFWAEMWGWGIEKRSAPCCSTSSTLYTYCTNLKKSNSQSGIINFFFALQTGTGMYFT